MQLWTWQLWASEWSPSPPWSELCSGFLSLESLFKGVKDIVIFVKTTKGLITLTLDNIVWFHIQKWQVSADTSSSAGLSSCWDLCVPQHLSSASQQRMQRRTWGRTQHVEKAVVPGGWCWGWPRALWQSCAVRGAQGVLALCCQVAVTLPMVIKIHRINRKSNWFSWTGKRYKGAKILS